MSMAKLDDHEEILTEILLRLPTKVTSECKVVCKRWFHLISSSYFAKRVLENMVSISGQNPPWDLLYIKYHFKGHEVKALEGPLRLHLAFELIPEYTTQSLKLGSLPNDENMRVLAVENGLVLWGKCESNSIHARKHNAYYVCNPITGKCVSLPKPRHQKSVCAGFIVTFNNGNTKFKVVRLYYHRDSGVSKFEVFSSDDDQWRDTGVTCPDLSINTFTCMSQSGVICNGILHWFAFARKNLIIIAYDSDKNQCRYIDFGKLGIARGILGTSGGCLCHLSVSADPSRMMSVWVLDNYASEYEEWRPKILTETRKVLDANELFGFDLLPLAIHPFDMNTVYFEGRRPLDSNIVPKILSFNLKTQKFDSLTKEIELRRCFVKSSIFPFVIPPLPTSVPHPIWETN